MKILIKLYITNIIQNHLLHMGRYIEKKLLISHRIIISSCNYNVEKR